MVHCPQCGAVNPDGTKLCSECGSDLPTQGNTVRCPMCSHSNPPERNMCEQCGARLIPLVAPSPLQEPTDTAQDQGPPFPAPPPEALPIEAPSAPQDDETDQEVPDWLQRMRDSARFEESPGDGWPPEPEPEAAAGEDVDWLSRLESSGTPSLEELEPDQMEVPDWLGRLGPMPAEEEPVTPPPSEAEVPDWLARLAPAEAEPKPPPPPAAEVPDWLAELAPPAEVPAQPLLAGAEEEPTGSPVETEMPDWLAELRGSEQEPTTPPTAEVVQEPTAPTSPVEADAPDWLTELAPAEEEPATPSPAAADVPDWLIELTSDEEEPIAPPAAEAEVPDWLAELTSGEQEPTPPPPVEIEKEPTVPAPPAEAEVPDWLAELAPAEEQPTAPPLTEAEVPDWIAELAPAEQEPGTSLPAATEAPEWLAEPTPAEKEPTAPPLAAAEVPDWLTELAPADEKPATPPLARDEVPEWLAEPAPAEAGVPDWLVEPTPAEPEPTPSPAEAGLPDWLTDLTPAEEEFVAPQPTEAGSAPEESGLAQAVIPVWLQALRPGVAPAPVPKEEEEEEVVETSGLLAGISGVIQPASAVTPLPTAPTKPEQIGAEAALARARLWQELIARSAQPAPLELPQPHVRKARDRIERWLVYGLVLVAVMVPILAGIDLSDAFRLDEPLTEGADAAFDLVDERVTQDALVLMAFDYDPSFMGELQVLAEALLHQLAQNKGRIIAMSLTPEGASLAQQLLEDVLDDQGYQAGQDYVNLGYLPGEAVGIRSLEFLPGRFQNQGFDGRDLKDTLIFKNDAGFALSNMSLMVVLTGNANNLRWWVEQTTAVETDLDRDLFLVAGVSAAIEPLVRPYYDMSSPQIDGLIVGLQGAVDYERRLNWRDGPAHIRFSGQVIGQIAVLALILLGMLIYGVSRRDGIAG
jgi:hypothetical protein